MNKIRIMLITGIAPSDAKLVNAMRVIMPRINLDVCCGHPSIRRKEVVLRHKGLHHVAAFVYAQICWPFFRMGGWPRITEEV